MNAVTVEELLRAVHLYYPRGFPPEKDLGVVEEPYKQTPEIRRFQDAWRQALETEPWETLTTSLEAELAHHEFGCYTPAYHSACYVCIDYLRTPRPDGAAGHQLVRVAGAISLIAPVYLVYETRTLVTPLLPDEQAERDRKGSGPLAHHQHEQLFLSPTEELQPTATVMARVIERTLGHRPFPPALADLAVPGVRVPFVHDEPPTLLQALFLQSPEHLP